MVRTDGGAVLQVHPTRLCNLRCLHCYSSSGPDVAESVPVGVLSRVVADAAALGYDVLDVSGGEPFLYPELPALLRAARAAGMRTTVTTNAVALTQRRIGLVRGLVDLAAVSLDGDEGAHDRIRDRPGCFGKALAGIRRLTEAGIPVGVTTTLTQGNATRLGDVAVAAARSGALLLRVRPLEPEGAANRLMAGERPDAVELAYAAVELGRVAEEHGLAVRLDAVPRTALVRAPAAFMAAPVPAGRPLGGWLTPLVVEANGAAVPVSYGFDRRYGLGNVHDRPLRELARDWDAGPFQELCRTTWRRLVDNRTGPLIPWHGHLVRASRTARTATADR
ncbi:radical SAM protein [Saccharothrix algeriensis]|uniref:MoaA/NifB/PqqE/SkfB family radical SAM enzyme n=1 Tax=Saccharothrix algeriensis TaxID=173560 RepID=A0A8T8HV16_9PSEU|nr:radical SAM protein [Saccharothrix algeriensis]MBM7813883.1 MoaA/NifB/PqqE/SkfB family radical SAM enzyme [Saccharothrix algeriensis]QTR02316.1 radical SAM protein [Saccharothrix algeriensis]